MSNPADREFCKETLKISLTNRIPINRLKSGFRGWLQDLSKQKLAHPHDLKSDYVHELLSEEEALQRNELRDKMQSIIYDATPRQGDLFGMVSRSMDANPEKRQAKAVHRLIHVSTIKGSLNAATLSAEVSVGLMARQIMHGNVPAAAMDRCFTNSASMNNINEAAQAAGEVERFASYCMSHLLCNAGDKAAFVLLELFWTLLQKIFSQSTQAQDIWIEVTGMSWPTYSETRWFPKYDVFEKIGKLFPDMLTVITKVTQKKFLLLIHRSY